MNEIAKLVERIQNGESAAYAAVVERFQDMAVSYAYAALNDMDSAKDVAQEAFIAAYYAISALQEPRAFPGWFRRIVHTQINRVQRRQQPVLAPLVEAETLPMPRAEPQQLFEQELLRDEVAQAICSLPGAQRQVVALFYMGDYSQQEIGDFLNIPVSTVKMRLYHARQRLKERMIDMVQNSLYNQRPSRNATFQQDVQAMLAIIQARPPARTADYPGAVDLHELMGVAETQAHTRLWEDECGAAVGFAIVEPAYRSLTFEVAPPADHAQVGAEMIAWAADQLRAAGHSSMRISCRTDNRARVELLTAHGFVAEPMSNLHLQRSLAQPIPTPQLAAGFTIQHMTGEHEVQKMVELHRAAFGTENMTVAYRLSMMRVPDYEPALDLIAVAPDGEWAAFGMASISHAENQQLEQPIGWLDPIGTRPKFQRRGLAKALMLTGLTLLKERGMKVAGTNTSHTNMAMQGLAAAIGFQEAARTNWYRKEIG
ncbi:MAG: GNAT family N-acetyltransferase [Caldilineaceae bacterium]